MNICSEYKCCGIGMFYIFTMLAKVLQLGIGACLCVFSVDIAAHATDELPDQLTDAVTGSDESFQWGLMCFGAFIGGWALFGIFAFSFGNFTLMKVDIWFNGLANLIMFAFGCIFIFYRNSDTLFLFDETMRGYFTDGMQDTPQGNEKYCPESLPIVADPLEDIQAYIKHIEVTWSEPLAKLGGISENDCRPAIIRADQQTCLDTALKDCQDAIIRYINITNYDMGLVMIMVAFFGFFVMMASWKVMRSYRQAQGRKIRQEKEEKKRALKEKLRREQDRQRYERDLERQRKDDDKRSRRKAEERERQHRQQRKQKEAAKQTKQKPSKSQKGIPRDPSFEDCASAVYVGQIESDDYYDYDYV